MAVKYCRPNIYFLMACCLVLTTSPVEAENCTGTCPIITGIEVHPPLPPEGECYPSNIELLTLSCPPGWILELECTTASGTTGLGYNLRCMQDPNYYFTTDNPPPPANCPDPTPCPSQPPMDSDTVWIIIIVIMGLLLILSWSGLLVFYLRIRNRKQSKGTKKELQNDYTPAPKKSSDVNKNKRKEKMSMSSRPPLPNPRPENNQSSKEAVGYATPHENQDEYAYIDPTQINDPNDYLEVDG